MFDIGVCNQLAGRKSILPHTELFGKSFEQFIFCELHAYLQYANDKRPLTFYRDYSGNEVDFIIGDDVAIEVKSTGMVTDKRIKALQRFTSENIMKYAIVVSLDAMPRQIGKIEVLPWKEFLLRLWGGAY